MGQQDCIALIMLGDHGLDFRFGFYQTGLPKNECYTTGSLGTECYDTEPPGTKCYNTGPPGTECYHTE